MVRLYKSGLMVHQVAEKAGVSYSTAYRRLASVDALRGKKSSIRLSVKQGRFAEKRIGIKRPPINEETRKKMSEAQLSRNSGRGWCLTSQGYVIITKGEHKDRLQHIVFMEKEIGRKLLTGECVHHINGDRKDNRLENLRLMSVSDHSSLHARENYLKRKRNEKGQFV